MKGAFLRIIPAPKGTWRGDSQHFAQKVLRKLEILTCIFVIVCYNRRNQDWIYVKVHKAFCP